MLIDSMSTAKEMWGEMYKMMHGREEIAKEKEVITLTKPLLRNLVNQHNTSMIDIQQSNMDAYSMGADFRPPILRRGEYTVWRKRFINFLESKDEGIKMLSSITGGPARFWKTIPDSPENIPASQELKIPSEYTEQERLGARADLTAKAYLLQAIPNEIYMQIISMSTAKEMWDEMYKMMQGTEVGAKVKKVNMLTTYDPFKAKQGE
ncbi:unnamed protein product [Cuscuta epithymum]|uniref:Uncharacterized protein n=1 Tax=Cuscuta epithymum TaxID=186058 RepID=A0AAV0E4J5_9ASTE|nr:unnamed protein product [Cuscuta epithymum]